MLVPLWISPAVTAKTARGAVIADLCLFILKIIAVVRQQFVLGINCLNFFNCSSFGANKRLVMSRKSSEIVQGLLCAGQQV